MTVAMIVCKERYADMVSFSVSSFLKYHPETNICVLVDAAGAKAMSGISGKKLKVVPLGTIREEAKAELSVLSFSVFPYGKKNA